MEIKRVIISFITILSFIGILGGCGVGEKEVTLTKGQQDNVVRWIAIGYEVESVEFTNFGKNKSTGSYLLSMKINHDNELGTVNSSYDFEKFDKSNGTIGLDPVENFEKLKKVEVLAKDFDFDVDIRGIEIIYLGN